VAYTSQCLHLVRAEDHAPSDTGEGTADPETPDVTE